MLAVTLCIIIFFRLNLVLVEVALCTFLLLSKSFLNSLIFCSISFSPTHVRTKDFHVEFFVQSFHFILLKIQIGLKSHPFVFCDLLPFWLNILIEKVHFFALKDAYFSLDSYTFWTWKDQQPVGNILDRLPIWKKNRISAISACITSKGALILYRTDDLSMSFLCSTKSM